MPPLLTLEILNQIPFKRYEALSDYLAFLGIYDDDSRRKVWTDLLERHQKSIEGAVVVELGAGFGEFSALALELGARKVYAVERNPYMYQLLKERLSGYKNVRVIKADALKFSPPEEVGVIIHDFYGPLLYDESLYVLDNLPYRPRLVLPNGGSLVVMGIDSESLNDPLLKPDVLRPLEGVIVADLVPLDDKPKSEEVEVANWRFGRGLNLSKEIDVGRMDGDLLLFYMKVQHNGRDLCDPFTCTNWSLGWTPRVGDVFTLNYRWDGDFTRVSFRWVL
ncbi:MAG: hypothetical protein GXO39_08975 [Thermotogae bacterium]|nr:hypothetical protein [Thermotogota bacterium]